MRQLKHHEAKLLKKTSLYDWRDSRNVKENELMARYGVYSRQEYLTYCQTIGRVRRLAEKLKDLPQDNLVRVELTRRLSRLLYDMGAVNNALSGLDDLAGIKTAQLLARRLPVMLVRLKMAEKVADAVKVVEQGHVRIGPNVVTNPATHVARAHEDFITWTKTSAYRRKIQRYNDEVDDYDLLH